MEREINELIKECLHYFKSNSYSSDRIRTYTSLWKNGILPFMSKRETNIYTTTIGRQFVDSLIQNTNLSAQVREKIRSVYVLDDFLTLGYIRKRRTIPVEHPLLGEIGVQMQKHIQYLQWLRRSKVTINRNKVYMYRFLVYLERNGVEHVNDIQEKHIWGFLSSSGTNNRHVISTLRVLFKFWDEQKITNRNLSDFLIFYRSSKHEKIPSYYSDEEIGMIEGVTDRTGRLGKRNYAILLLASRLGLRVADIAGLKFSNIDWEQNEIRLEQQKTGNLVSLPLLREVGNAIINYLQYGRRKSDSPYIFLLQRPPYTAITSVAVSSVIRQIIIKSGVLIENRKHGAHSMRHSLASNLLAQDTSLPIITEILGHVTSESTMRYLKIDVKSLMRCALHVPPISEDFYNQKGGLFYE